MSKLKIPFIFNNQNGTIEIEYEENDSVVKSGFDILSSLNFDINMCIGYPTLHAYITEFKATGYKRYCGWIQILELQYFNSSTSIIPDTIINTIDCGENRKEPFFAYGYPAEIYDAPCNNLGNNFKLIWIARTYLVTVPCVANNETVSFITGFRWGYTEQNTKNNKHTVKINDIYKIEEQEWKKDVAVLKHEFPDLNYI